MCMVFISSQHDPVRSDGQLYRLIQQELLRAKATVNIEELRKMFGKADRLFRLTLSQPQVRYHQQVIGALLFDITK